MTEMPTTPPQSIQPVARAVPYAARPLPLQAVRLTGGPLKHAQDLNASYLLELEPDRMMAYYRIRAGLEPKAEGYGGWDGGGRNLTGHIAGHYLSAVSLMYAATGDARFKERADYLVREMAEVQAKHGNGYLGALEDGEEKFAEVARGEIRSGGFDLNGLWAPWYTLHKTYAGLRDAYRFTGNRAALDVEIQFAAWAESVLADLDEAQTQKMLATEFGGMNEVLADLYADTGDRRWLDLSDRFEHHAVLDPLKRGENNLPGLHGNTQVPKLLGSLSRYVSTSRAEDGGAARFFWDIVVTHHTFATGGHGKDEYFGPADQLGDRLDGRTCEACNIYNMLRMTRTLFGLAPDAKFAEFQERALFNHVLGSIDPEDGRVCYMVPIGRGVEREYQDRFHDFTCCVGSGMESHALHGDGIYYGSEDRLWVNIYTPSTARWEEAGLTLSVETGFPEGDVAILTLALDAPRRFALSLRHPSWTGDGFAVRINGETVSDLTTVGGYVTLERLWQSGDIVSVALPKSLRHEAAPDNPNRVALMWGPLVLAGDLGPEGQSTLPDIPVFVAAGRPEEEWLKSLGDLAGQFESAGVGQPHDVALTPFYRLHRRTYAAYWDLYTPEEWEVKAAEVAEEQEKRRRLEAATVAYAQPGEMQPERDFNQQGEDSAPDRIMGLPARRAAKWFSFDLPVDPAHALALVVTYNTEERMARSHDILVDGVKIGEHAVERSRPGSVRGEFHDVSYPLPADLVSGKEKVTVRFEATDGKETAAVFGIRMARV
jgi:hypothetical protein